MTKIPNILASTYMVTIERKTERECRQKEWKKVADEDDPDRDTMQDAYTYTAGGETKRATYRYVWSDGLMAENETVYKQTFVASPGFEMMMGKIIRLLNGEMPQ